MPSALDLESSRVAGLPLVNAVLDRLGLDRLLSGAVPDRGRLPAAKSPGVLLRNIALHDRQPAYTPGEWASSVEPSLLGIEAGDAAALNDDRVGRALDRLFDADRAALMTEVVLRTLREYEVDTDQLHNDSTTLTLTGDFRDADDTAVRGKPTLEVTYGHNKDHRPDLKQLLFILTISADGVPGTLCSRHRSLQRFHDTDLGGTTLDDDRLPPRLRGPRGAALPGTGIPTRGRGGSGTVTIAFLPAAPRTR